MSGQNLNAGDNIAIRGEDGREWYGKVAKNVMGCERVSVWCFLQPGIDVARRGTSRQELFLSDETDVVSIQTINRWLDVTETRRGQGHFWTRLWLNGRPVKPTAAV